MRFLILLVIFPSFVYADQGVKISCVNMKNLLDQNYKIHKFKFDVTTFQYFDEKESKYIEIPNKDLTIKKDFFAARFPEYELGFQINVFSNKKKVENNELETVILQRRSIRAKSKLPKGLKLKSSDLISLRPCPSNGLMPFEIKKVVGKTLKKNIEKGDIVKWEDIKP